MIRLGRKNKKFPFFAMILVVGVVVLGLALSQTPELEQLLPLSFLLERECFVNTIGFGQVSFGDLECRLIIGSLVGSRLPEIRSLPLTEVDVNSPMILTLTYVHATQGNPVCDATITDPTVTLSDENGNIIATPQDNTDIQPLLVQGQQTLIIRIDGNFDPAVCADGDVRYNGQLKITFLQKPPEIEEFTNPLLAQWLYLADFRDQGVVETATRFAVAESFQLNDPTVITGLRVRIGSDLSTSEQDIDTSLTAFVWNLDKTPPERVVQSAETFTGIIASRPELDIDFTFPNSVALLPTTNYGVGIRVDQNLGQKFVYMQSNQTTNTHECVIDRNSSIDGEINFVPNGLCGFDIFHSQFRASQLLGGGGGQEGEQGIQGEQGIEGIQGIGGIQGIQGIQGEPAPELSQEEILEIICEGRTDGICREGSSLLGLFQIGESSFDILLLIAGIIIFIGIIGFIVRRR